MTRRVRTPAFARSSALPTSAACVVANGVRETLGALLGASVEMRLLEPSLPPALAWAAIVDGALLYRTRGSVADAALVLRPADALALAAGLFGERLESRAQRELSPIERDVLDRTANAIAAHLGAVCGAREVYAVERVGSIGGFATYFELALEAPVSARIGVALSRDPDPEVRGRLEVAHLGAVPLAMTARIDLGARSTASVSQLAPGGLLSIRPSDLHCCALCLHGRDLARASFGVRNGRYALRIEALTSAAS